MTLPLFPSYIEIPLTQGQVAVIDSEDYELVSQWKWHADWSENGSSYYARAHRGEIISMHRLILGLSKGDKRQGDHINGNTLDNRRGNLRVSTHAQNQQNKGINRQNTSGFKGVNMYRNGMYRASIRVNGKQQHLGYRPTPESAHALYVEAANRLHGEFARTS